MINKSDFDLGWAIGFIEGEGSIGVDSTSKIRRYCYLRIQVINTELESLIKLQDILGGKIYGPYKTKHQDQLKINKNPKPHYRWCLAKQKEVLQTIDIIKPYLSKRRQKQIENAIHTKNSRRG